MRKKLVAGALAFSGVLALGVGGTYASFSSTTQGPNTLVQAGKLDLLLTDENGVAVPSLSFEDLKPGDQRSYFVKLTNGGTVPAARVKWAFENTHEFENGCGAPETAAGDTTCLNDEGELGSQLAVTFSQMTGSDCDGTPEVVNPEAFSPAFSLGFTSINGLVLDPGESKCVQVGVRFKELTTNNLAQGDSSSFGFRFQLVS